MKNRYVCKDDTVLIYLKSSDGEVFTVIDLVDFELVNSFPNTWSLVKEKRGVYVRGEVVQNGKRHRYYLHRILMYVADPYIVGHKDKNSLNNRRNNLMKVTRKQNQQNQKVHSRSKSGIKGVTAHGQRWRVRVGKVYLGCFNSLSEAERVAKEAYKKYLPYYQFEN